jgi:hypothetical protein
MTDLSTSRAAGESTSLEDLLMEAATEQSAQQEKSSAAAEENVAGWVEDDHHLECVFDFASSARGDGDRACMAVRQGQVPSSEASRCLPLL